MAEAVGTEIAKICLEKVISGAFKEVRYALGVKSHIKNLEKTIAIFEAYLLDVNAAQATSHAQQLMLEQLSDFLEKLRDFLDARAARAMRYGSINKVLWLFSLSSNPIVCALRDARQVKAYMEELDHIGNLLRMPFQNVISQTWMQCIETGPRSSEVVIGRDEDRDNIVRMLLSSYSGHETFSVVSIVGIGGMGKTTLAQYVFNDGRVENHFDTRLWVHVPQVLKVKEVIQNMLKSAPGNPLLSEMPMAQLQDQLQSQIFGKKYLLVLDNIWNREELHLNWPELRQQLGFGGAGSMVLTTTRSAKVAQALGTVDPYVLRGLAPHDSWNLFQRLAFTQQHEPHLEAIGKEIAQKCPNVPLVIHSAGCHLRGKHTTGEWEDFKDKLGNLSYYGQVPRVMQTLKLSYDELDQRLKLCFAYLSLFPKGYKFREADLIHLWIALGYVEKPSGNEILVDMAKDYILRLKEKGLLVQDTFVQMHDVIHDLALSIAGPKYKMIDSGSLEFNEKIQHVSFNTKAMLSGNFPCSLPCEMKKQVHSLLLLDTLYNSLKLNLKGLSKFECLRVLRLRCANLEEVPRTIGKLIHLRYLDLSYNSFWKLPNAITGLVNLVFLNLGGCQNIKELPRELSKLVNLVFLNLSCCKNIKELPRELSKLQNLIYLNLGYCSAIGKLPRDMGKLIKLREFCLYGCKNLKHMPSGLGNMKDLQSLGLFVAVGRSSSSANPSESDDGDMGKLADLNQLNNLEGSLHIVVDGSWSSESEARAANLQGKKKLLVLKIDFKGGSDRDNEIMLQGIQPHSNVRKLEIMSYRGEKLPSWINDGGYYLPNLEEIVIDSWKGSTCVGSFGRLPRLWTLEISECENLEYIESSSGHNLMNADADIGPHPDVRAPSAAPLFPSLERLELRDLPKLKGWRRMSGCRSSSKDENSMFVAGATAFSRLKTLKLERVGLEAFPEEFKGLFSLESLSIWTCKHLKELPKWIDTFTSLKFLKIGGCCQLTFWPKQLAKLSNLEELEIYDCPNLQGRPTSEDWPPIPRFPKLKRLILARLGLEEVTKDFEGLPLLEELYIDDCQQLEKKPEWISTLTSLKLLHVRCSSEWTSLPMHIGNLAGLKELTIEATGLEVVPEELRGLSSLEVLQIEEGDQLKELPEWIDALTSLKQLIIMWGPKLTSLPKQIANLVNLKKLQIEGACPDLEERCRKPTGEDWHLIQHVPFVNIGPY